MQRLAKKILIFSIPFMVWAGVVILVDPFNYFNVSGFIPDEVKAENVEQLNSLMYNMVKFKNQPSEYVIIGDSRIGELSTDQILEVTGRKYFMLYANALKLNESVDLFWYANGQRKIRGVIFGINFNQFNAYAYNDRVKSVESILDNPLLYVFDRNVAEAVLYVVKSCVTGKKELTSIPDMTREKFWDYIVTVRGQEHFARYRYPQETVARIRHLVEYTRRESIDVMFIIAPQHGDYQSNIRKYGLVKDYLRFKEDMSELGVMVLDYDYANEMTNERKNFRDPLHMKPQIAELIVREVFSGNFKYGRKLNAEWLSIAGDYLF